MNFFFDRNMSIYIARTVDAYERNHRIVHHDEEGRFCQKTPDVEWITALASDPEPWAVLSADGRILKNKAEKAALDEAKLTFFCLTKTWANGMNFHEYTWKLIRIWPKILEMAKHPTPRVYEVTESKVDLFRNYT